MVVLTAGERSACPECGKASLRRANLSRLLDFGRFCSGHCKQRHVASLTLAPTCVLCSRTTSEDAEAKLRHWCCEGCRDEYLANVASIFKARERNAPTPERKRAIRKLRDDILACEYGFQRPPEMQTLHGYLHSNDADTWGPRPGLDLTGDPRDPILDHAERSIPINEYSEEDDDDDG
jgi:hypothetical protein